MAKAEKSAEIQVVEMGVGEVSFCILGTRPVILNRMSNKAKQELLFPRGRKTAGDKLSSLKHDPMREFRESPYTDANENGPTLLQALSVWFKKGICCAALDVPGANKSQMGRLITALDERIALYGIPKLHMSVTRSADMNKTPDVRTRAIVPQWACKVTIRFAKPQLNDVTITNLLVAAGMLSGIGDWRNQKGSESYGSYEPVSADNPEFLHIVKTGGRKAQVAAMEHPDFYDQETEDLYRWFELEVAARGKVELLEQRSCGAKNRLKNVRRNGKAVVES